MIRLQDIADMAGVSRTTVSNVINGNTKRVSQAHGMYSLQDSFVGELVGTIQMEAEMKGYYVMLIGGENIQNVVDIASRWNVEGLIILGYNDEKYRKLSRKLNKKMVLIDAYPAGEYFFQNVMIIPVVTRSEVTFIPVALIKHCSLQRQTLTVITAAGWALSRLWKKKENSAAAPA